jgi:HEAT repeat protein
MLMLEVCILHAREDKHLLHSLRSFLKPLEQQRLINVWCQENLLAGESREEVIRRQLKAAQLILVLISPDFVASDWYDYWYSSQEGTEARARSERGEVKIIYIYLRPAPLKDLSIDERAVLPDNREPVTGWKNRHKAMQNIWKGIRIAIEEIAGVPISLAVATEPILSSVIVDDLKIYLEMFINRYSSLPEYFRHSNVPRDSIRQYVKVSRRRLNYQEEKIRERDQARRVAQMRKADDSYWEQMNQLKIEAYYQPRGSEAYEPQELSGKQYRHSQGRSKDEEQFESVVVNWEEVSGQVCQSQSVILGEPGFGKTWFLQHEGCRVAHEQLAHLRESGTAVDAFIIPVYLPLNLLAQELMSKRRAGMVEVIVRCMQKTYGLPERILPFVKQCIASSHCLLLLDALDEVQAKHRPLLLQELQQWTEKTETHILLTSRMVGYRGCPFPRRRDKKELGQELELVAFDQEQVESFIEQWFGKEQDQGRIQQLKELLRHDPVLRSLVRIPLMLTFFCFAASSSKDLPTYRAEVYRRVLFSLLKGEWRSFDLQPANEDAVLNKLEALEGIAWHFANKHGQWQDLLPGDEVRRFISMDERVRKLFPRRGTLFSELCERDGVLVKVGEPQHISENISVPYQFLHRTFYEYLVAIDTLVKIVLHRGQEDYKVYDSALDLLARMGGPKAINVLGQLLQTRDLYTVERIASLLAEQDSPQARNVLEESLQQRTASLLAEQGSPQARSFFAESQRQEDEKVREMIEQALKVKVESVKTVEDLARELREGDWLLRKEAVESLKKLGSPQAIDALLQEFDAPETKSDGWLMYRTVSSALAEIGTPQVVAGLLRSSRIGEAVEALSKINDPQGQNFLQESIDDGNVRVRRLAALALAKRGDARAIDVLLAALDDEDVAIRSMTVEILGEIRDARAVEGLVKAMRDRDPEICHQAIAGIGQLAPSEAVTLLREALYDPEVSWTAAQTLAEIGTPQAIEELATAAQDQDAFIRENAAISLAEVGDFRAIDQIIALLQDKHENYDDSWERRIFVVEEILAKVKGDPRVVDALVAELQGDVRIYAAEALGQMDDMGAVEGLLKALRSEEGSDEADGDEAWDLWRLAAAEALDQLGQKVGALEALTPLLEQWDPLWEESDRYLERILSILESVGDEQAIEALIALLRKWGGYHHDDTGERIERTLQNMGARIVDATINVLKDKHTYIGGRKAAARVLGRIEDERSKEALLQVLVEARQEKLWGLCGSVAWGLRYTKDTQAVMPVLDTAQAALNDLQERYMEEYRAYLARESQYASDAGNEEKYIDDGEEEDTGKYEDGILNEDEFIDFRIAEYLEEADRDLSYDENEYYILHDVMYSLEELVKGYDDLPTFYDRLLAMWPNKALDWETRKMIYEDLLIAQCARLRQAVGEDWPAWRKRLELS